MAPLILLFHTGHHPPISREVACRILGPTAAPAQRRNPGQHGAPGPGLGLLPMPGLARALLSPLNTNPWFLISISAFNASCYNGFRFLTCKPVSQIISADTFCSVHTELQVATHKLQTLKNQATSHFYCKFPVSIK